MSYRYDTYCGLYCGSCPLLQANQKGTVEEIAKREKMKPGDLECHGCKSDRVAVFCRDCTFKSCAAERGHEFCVECDDYPCEELVKFRSDEWPHHSVVISNLERIRRDGLETWLKEREKRWRCRECGEEFTWYDEICESCGARLYNCRDESKDLESTTK
jgi:hypothetical protein